MRSLNCRLLWLPEASLSYFYIFFLQIWPGVGGVSTLRRQDRWGTPNKKMAQTAKTTPIYPTDRALARGTAPGATEPGTDEPGRGDPKSSREVFDSSLQ